MSDRFEESVNEALERLASVDARTVEAVRTSFGSLPDRPAPAALGRAALLSSRFRRNALGLAIVIVAGFTAVLLPVWRANTGPGVPMPSAAASPFNPAMSQGTTEPSTFADPGGDVYDMQRLTLQSGWALLSPQAGSAWKLMVTDDAGASWRGANPPGVGAALPSVKFVDPDHAWLVQTFSVDPDHPNAPIASTLWRTSDGGRHWQTEALPIRAIFGAAISFVEPDKGYLVLVPDAGADYRRTLVFSTSDGARTWTEVGRISGELQFDAPPADPLVAVTEDDSVLVSGRALQTHDGGRTWSTIGLPRPAEIPAGSQVDVRQLVVAGGDLLVAAQYYWKTGASYTYAPGYEFVSHDRGRTWSLAWSGSQVVSERVDVVGIDEATLYRFPDYAATIPDAYGKTFSVTHDAGRTWSSIHASLPLDTHFDIESFADALNGWAVISDDAHCPAGTGCPPSGGLPGLLVATSDGGSTWATGASR